MVLQLRCKRPHVLAPLSIEIVGRAAEHDPGETVTAGIQCRLASSRRLAASWEGSQVSLRSEGGKVAMSPQERARCRQAAFFGGIEQIDIAAKDMGRGNVLLDKRHAGCAAAKRLQSHSAGASEEINCMPPANSVADEVEDRLTDTMFHRPGDPQAVVLKSPSPVVAADDRERILGAGRLRLGRVTSSHQSRPSSQVHRDIRTAANLSSLPRPL